MKKTIIVICTVLILFTTLFFVLKHFMTYEFKKIDYNINSEQFITEDINIITDNILNNVDGIYYFGFSGCTDCRNFLPLFDAALLDLNKKSYVINTKDENYTVEINEEIENYCELKLNIDFKYVPFVLKIQNDVPSILGNAGIIDKNITKNEIIDFII